MAEPSPMLSSNPKPGSSNHLAHKTLASAANLANLLPTGTVLAFQALRPSFTNNGTCHVSNQCLTIALLAVCGTICFLSSFTDSFTHNGKLYYGVATFKGFYVFNGFEDFNGEAGHKDLSKYKLQLMDLVHAFMSLGVFIVFGFSSSNVLSCFFPDGVDDLRALVTNLPLGVGLLSSFLFTIFPTTRRGIGYSDMVPEDT